MPDIFDATNTEAKTVVPVTKVDDLVGDGKKFATVDDLAKGKAESDAFIDHLKAEINQLKEVANRQMQAQTELDALKTQLKTLREAPQSKDNTNPALSEDKIKSLVENAVTQAEANKTATQNILEANVKIVSHYGTLEKATQAVQAKARELGISVDMMKDIAAKSPTAFLNLVGVQGQTGPQEVNIQGTVNTTGFGRQSSTPETETQAYFSKMLKENPREYFTPAVQQRYFKLVKEGKISLPG